MSQILENAYVGVGSVSATVQLIGAVIFSVIMLVVGMVMIMQRKVGVGALVIVIGFLFFFVSVLVYNWVHENSQNAATYAVAMSVFSGGAYAYHKYKQWRRRQSSRVSR